MGQEKEHENIRQQLAESKSETLKARSKILQLQAKLNKFQKESIEMKTLLENKNTSLIQTIKQLQANLNTAEMVICEKSNEINILHRKLTQIDNVTRNTLIRRSQIMNASKHSENVKDTATQEIQNKKMQIHNMKHQIAAQNTQIDDYKRNQTILLKFSEKHQEQINKLQMDVDTANKVRDKMQVLLIDLEEEFFKEKKSLQKLHEQKIEKLKEYTRKLETDLRNVISEMVVENQTKYVEIKDNKDFSEPSKNPKQDICNQLEGNYDIDKNDWF